VFFTTTKNVIQIRKEEIQLPLSDMLLFAENPEPKTIIRAGKFNKITGYIVIPKTRCIYILEASNLKTKPRMQAHLE
jgi:hypothetical protein